MAADPARFIRALDADDTVLVEGGAAASRVLPRQLCEAPELPPLTVTGIMVPGVNEEGWPREEINVETFFMTQALARRDGVTRLLPLSYSEIGQRLRAAPPRIALFSVSPPDAAGMCSFGPTVDFIADLWSQIPVRIVHVNPAIPRTAGPIVPLSELQVACESVQPLFALECKPSDPLSQRIAANVAPFIEDGATLQTGLGKLPDAILAQLRDRRGLRFHTGLIGDGVLDLLQSGAISDGGEITTGVAIGSRRLYDALSESGIRFAPARITHDWRAIAACQNFVAINSALSIDLYGQAVSERTARGWMSGTGGATDFARGAALGGGLRIIALPASAAGRSRIIAPLDAEGPITLGRQDIDIVATEHGAADLRGLDIDARARALIAIAAPGMREELERDWREGAGFPREKG